MGQTISYTFGSSPAEIAPNFGPELKRPHPDDVNDAAMPAPKTAKAHANAVAGSSEKSAPAGAQGSVSRGQGRSANSRGAPLSAMAPLVTPSTCSGSTSKSVASSATSATSLSSVQQAAPAPSPVARIATLFGLGAPMASLATPAAASAAGTSNTATSIAHLSSQGAQEASAVSGGVGAAAADDEDDNDDEDDQYEDALSEHHEDESAPQSPPWATLADCAADSFAIEASEAEGSAATTAAALAAGKSAPNAEKSAREEYREGQVVWAWARLPSNNTATKKESRSSSKVVGVWWPALVAHKKSTMQRFLGMYVFFNYLYVHAHNVRPPAPVASLCLPFTSFSSDSAYNLCGPHFRAGFTLTLSPFFF